MLTSQEQSTLLARSSLSQHNRGTIILSEGVPCNQVTIIHSGWTKATVIKAARPVLLRLYGPGDLIGVSAALTGTPPTETVTASNRPIFGISLSAHSFADFLRQACNASAALHYLQQWRLEEADRLRTIRDYPTAAQRLAGLLCELCRPENAPIQHPDGALSVPNAHVSQQELGSWIGDSRKTVVRALAELRRLGLTRTSPLREMVEIAALDRLQAFADAADAGRPLTDH
jgi:CRP/FNR family cyclic AMP-dependent transcriptional regulator